MVTVRSSVGAAFIALCLAGCDATEPEAGLTLAEAEALFTGVMAKSDVVTRLPDTVVVGCFGGGDWEVAAARTRWESGDTIRWTSNYEITPGDCFIQSADLRFTLDGDPGLEVERVTTYTDNLADITGTVLGGIRWVVDQRRGACAMDLALEVEIGESSVDAILRGMLCGHDVTLDGAPVLDLSFW